MEYSIGEFSKITGLSIDTLRYYEKEHIIFSNRSDNNHRFYTDKDLNWAKFVLRLKQTGMSISNMKTYAQLRYEGDTKKSDRIKMLFEQLDILHAKQQEIENNIEFIENKIKTYLEL